MVHINQPVIRRVRPIEHRETVGILPPRKHAAIHNRAAKCRTVATHELGQGMHYDVSAVVYGPEQDGCWNGIVNDKRQPVLVSYVRERFDVADVSRWVSHAFAINGTSLVID